MMMRVLNAQVVLDTVILSRRNVEKFRMKEYTKKVHIQKYQRYIVHSVAIYISRAYDKDKFNCYIKDTKYIEFENL